MEDRVYSEFNYMEQISEKHMSRAKLERGVNIGFSMLSDVQELMAMGATEKANALINDVKLVLGGRFTEDSPFTCKIDRGGL